MSSKRASRTRNWAERQRKDPYVQKARKSAFRSRAVFKLQQLDQKERLLRSGMSVVDLGAAPGSWSQYAVSRVGPTGTVVAVDRLEMKAISGVRQIVGNFLDQEISGELHQALGERPLDLVISDLAPNLTGVSSVDQAAMESLVLAAVRFSQQHLAPNGTLVAKFFEGGQADSLRRAIETCFAMSRVRKPDASRAKSTESYIVARRPVSLDGV